MRRIYFGAEDKKGGAILNGPRVFENENLKKVNVISHIEEEKPAIYLKSSLHQKEIIKSQL